MDPSSEKLPSVDGPGSGELVTIAEEVLEIEAQAILGLKAALDASFEHAVQLILSSCGRVIASGMGKSGIIATKISATLASTGTPAFFMHPAEALHGDLGMVTTEDVFLAISNSGETEELVKLLPFLRDNGNRVVAMSGNAQSTLAKNSDIHLSTRVDQEACPLQLAPTASTTAALAMGDALAVAIMKARGFQAHHFARFHPGGSLGRRLLRRVRDEMHTEQLPFVEPCATAIHVLEITDHGKLGVCLVSVDRSRVLGIITDGDLRRAMQRSREGFFQMSAGDLMTPEPVTIGVDSSMTAALERMADHKITVLVVVDDDAVVGLLQK